MFTISVLNQKGGVGKTTTAHNLGMGLIARGYKVLFVDLDGQGNLSFTLKADTQKYNALRVLQRPETIAEEIQRTEQADILASTPALAGADSTITETGKEYRLKEALDKLKEYYDYCIIDTPPALGILTVNALTASDRAIIPAQADIFSLQGISQLYNTISTVKKYCNPTLEILGIVLTRFNQRATISRDVEEMLQETAGQLETVLFETKIRECTALKESQALRQDIFSYAPKSNATADYNELLNEIFELKR